MSRCPRLSLQGQCSQMATLHPSMQLVEHAASQQLAWGAATEQRAATQTNTRFLISRSAGQEVSAFVLGYNERGQMSLTQFADWEVQEAAAALDDDEADRLLAQVGHRASHGGREGSGREKAGDCRQMVGAGGAGRHQQHQQMSRGRSTRFPGGKRRVEVTRKS